MITGKRAEPGQMPLLDQLPERLTHVIEQCLEQDPAERWQTSSDLRRELQWAATSPLLKGKPVPGGGRRVWLAWSLAAVFLLAFVGLYFLHFRETPPADLMLRLTVPLPGNAPADFVALSPDGRRLAIQLYTEGASHLWLRSLDSPQLQLLAGTENARAMFWSPDGKSIGFFADGKLKTIPAAGGPPQVLCDGAGDGGTWNRDGVILFSPLTVGAPLQRVNASGGACTVATKPEKGHTHAIPEFLPDGKHFVYVVRDGDEATRGLYVGSLDTALDDSASRRLLADESGAVFVPSTTGKNYGYLLFLRGSELMAQPFSAETLQLAGDVFPVAAQASGSLTPSLIAASASAGGILVYGANLRGSEYQLTWLDRSGKELGKVGSVQKQDHVALSPDGRMAATTRSNQGAEIWLYDLQRGGESRFTSLLTCCGAPVWSPDGHWIAFRSGKSLYLKDASGGSKEELLLGNGNDQAPSDWSRDGRYLIYTETDPKGQNDIWYLLDPLSKSSKPKPVKFQGTEANESQGQLSPDGRWLAYDSKETGKREVYVRPFPSGPGRWKVSAGRGPSQEPRWRRDGKELFFLELEAGWANRLTAVAVQSGPGADFRVGALQALFEFRAIITVAQSNIFLYSPSADGQRFLVEAETRDAPPTLNVVTNWEKIALGVK
jgi:Tol biopolymer transport system component